MLAYNMGVQLGHGSQCSASLASCRQVPIQPGSKVRLLDADVFAGSSLEPGRQGLLVDDSGNVLQADDINFTLESYGTTLVMVAAEAWKVSSVHFNGALLRSLAMKPKEAKLLDGIVAAELVLRESERGGEDAGAVDAGSTGGAPTVDCNALAGSTGRGPVVGAVDSGVSVSASGGTSSSANRPTSGLNSNLNKESFDFIVSAFYHFWTEPVCFDWNSDDRHVEAVWKLSLSIAEAFQSQLDQPSRQGGNWLEETDDALAPMAADEFRGLVAECCAAHDMREQCNCGTPPRGSHPFHGRTAAQREMIFEVYQQAVYSKDPRLQRFPRLAAEAVKFVREELDTIAKRSARAAPKMVKPSW